jgi:hypothetical protein
MEVSRNWTGEKCRRPGKFFAQAAGEVQMGMGQADGLERAADVIEEAL